jgi:hypothetical protein
MTIDCPKETGWRDDPNGQFRVYTLANGEKLMVPKGHTAVCNRTTGKYDIVKTDPGNPLPGPD